MDAVSEMVRRDVPWDMLYADDLIVAEDASTSLQLRFGQWQRALETKGLKINSTKTETMVCSGVEESISIVDNKGSLLK